MAPMSKRNPTYYEILGIPSNAKHNDVGLAFNRKMRAIKREDAPPDLQGETKLKEAYGVLSDLDKRAAYDAKLRADIIKPKFGKNHAAYAAFFVVIVGAGLFWYLRPTIAPETVAPAAAAPGKPFQEVLNGAIPAVGRLQAVEMTGQQVHAGVAFTVEEGVAVTSCKGMSPTAQLKILIPPRVIPARVTLTDDELGLCKLEVPGAGTWPLSVSQVPAKVGDPVYTTRVGEGGEVTLLPGMVRAIKTEGKSTVLDVTTPLTAAHGGAPLLDLYGRVVAVANMPAGGKETYVAIPASWGETVKVQAEPKPYQGGGEDPAAPKSDVPPGQVVDDLGRSAEVRKKQDDLANSIDPERRKRLEKAYVPQRNIPE